MQWSAKISLSFCVQLQQYYLKYWLKGIKETSENRKNAYGKSSLQLILIFKSKYELIPLFCNSVQVWLADLSQSILLRSKTINKVKRKIFNLSVWLRDITGVSFKILDYSNITKIVEKYDKWKKKIIFFEQCSAFQSCFVVIIYI